MMEARVIEYPRSSCIDYHHNSPLIGEVPTNDYTHFHRSIDQLRSLNERGMLSTNNFQNVLIPASVSPIVVQSSGAMYSEVKLGDSYQATNKLLTSIAHNNESDTVSDDQKDDENDFQIINSPQQYSVVTAPISPQSSFLLEIPSKAEHKTKSKV